MSSFQFCQWTKEEEVKIWEESLKKPKGLPLIRDIKLNNAELEKVFIDSGSSRSCVANRVFVNRFSALELYPSNWRFTLGDGSAGRSKGVIVLGVHWLGHTVPFTFEVIREAPYDALIGLDFLREQEVRISYYKNRMHCIYWRDIEESLEARDTETLALSLGIHLDDNFDHPSTSKKISTLTKPPEYYWDFGVHPIDDPDIETEESAPPVRDPMDIEYNVVEDMPFEVEGPEKMEVD